MSPNNGNRLTPLEAVIMDAVWSSSRATVREVQERLAASKPMAYNTVLTMMRILRDKGFLASTRDGRMDVYRPVKTREQMSKGYLRDLVRRFFGGSARALVSQLLDSEDLSPEEVRAIRREVNGRLRASGKDKAGR